MITEISELDNAQTFLKGENKPETCFHISVKM